MWKINLAHVQGLQSVSLNPLHPIELMNKQECLACHLKRDQAAEIQMHRATVLCCICTEQRLGEKGPRWILVKPAFSKLSPCPVC